MELYKLLFLVGFISNVKIQKALITETMLNITEHVTAINNLASKNILLTTQLYIVSIYCVLY